MPELKPFKGIRYNTEQIENLTEVICQPYDQISNKMERTYKNRSPYNFVRLVLTKYAEGHDRQREYRDAKKSLDQWTEDDVFIQDNTPAIYPYWQEFTINDKTYVRKGFVCLVRLEELGKGNILPHEKTLSKPKADRLNLLRITHRDLEPVFLLYTDVENRVNKLIEKKCPEQALIEVEDGQKVIHRLWCIDDTKTVEHVVDALKNSIFVIADGHHRYETAYTFSSELKADKEHPANFKMITLVNIEDPGLVILPTHRLVKDVGDFSLVPFLEKTEKYFEIRKTDRDHITEHLANEQAQAFGFYSAQTAYILKLKDNSVMKEKLADRSAAYQDLDIAILHTLLIEDVLGVTSDTLEDHVRYERVVRTAMRRVDSGEFQFCFLMNPTRPEQVKEIAENKERMPQKSTDFFPKLISGLVHYDVAG